MRNQNAWELIEKEGPRRRYQRTFDENKALPPGINFGKGVCVRQRTRRREKVIDGVKLEELVEHPLIGAFDLRRVDQDQAGGNLRRANNRCGAGQAHVYSVRSQQPEGEVR